ncbi:MULTISPECIES: hypothetical protein [Sphingobacterium]|uniref:hypothetical protein n=1 Tax=Sphingobacterium TaxID=28453 RepID=UPI00038A41F0|nr:MULTISPECIES: hypothetical protein [Sphingobacterium]KKX48166.1 hypothetical protein L950_0222630 [Sphingobacterium sp. IITKGP-BTPF85]MCW2261439.1 hypothetical protein [Sphingobacterium kitahiroshimense]QQD14728.1 hypothetical protein JAZ75_04110 [Sphingobacterium sp. UDSM-2020]TCR09750.1 hypothetical protein EDF67_10518 [Sphingobacterium sp. JUb78]
MIIIRKSLALSGLILCLLAGMLPMLKVPIKGNWNLYQTDAALFFITYMIIGITALLFFVRQLTGYRLMTRVAAVWYLISISAVFFKINNYFGWGFADRLLSKSIHMRWGWIVYLVGIALLLLSVKKVKQIEE